MLRQEFEVQQRLYNSQPPLVQRFLEVQAATIADALDHHLPQVRFTLPDRVVCEPAARGHGKLTTVPGEQREQLAGGLIDRLTRTDLRTALRQRLAELEASQDPSISTAGALIRHATAVYMVHNMLPAGRKVNYIPLEGEEIATQPGGRDQSLDSAITATTDAITEEGSAEEGRGELIVPYVPAARRFYLPQWVAFDAQDQLLVRSINEAEAQVASMQHFLAVLHTSVVLAPYIVADDQYQQKRYGMLGQLVNQGRALARYDTREIISTIKRRAAANDLNRGLSLSLPYFDDQELVIKAHDFEVIPAGRIMFVPAFVVRAVREEQVKVAQDTRLSPSTRKHLLSELQVLEEAFFTKEKHPHTRKTH